MKCISKKNILKGNNKYKYGFVSNIDSNIFEKGLNEDVIKMISNKKKEPKFLLEYRLKAYSIWKEMEPPKWAHLRIPKIDFQEISYYAEPKKKDNCVVDPEIVNTFEKLGVPISDNDILKGVAVDAVIDSVSVATTFQEELSKIGIIFCSFSKAVKICPDLVQKYLGKVVPINDNYYATLNSAVFSDGSFCYIPPSVKCPMELSTYFRINAANTGQFERTLIIADEDSSVSYLEGCTAPIRENNQLHAAVVELFAHKNAEINYSTVQNWYPGDKNGKGGVFNLVTKRGLCDGDNSKISWTQVETGSAITWKYPSCVLKGDNSKGDFFSMAVTNNHQQADTGTKMIHIGEDTKSTIISKGVSAGKSQNSYRGLVYMSKNAKRSRNYSQCDSLLIGNKSGAHTFPTIKVNNNSSVYEHEATTSKISEDQIFYLNQRGLNTKQAVSMIINGYSKEVLNNLPMEFAVEAQKLLSSSLEGSIG